MIKAKQFYLGARFPAKGKVRLTGNVEVTGFDAKIIRTYDDFLRLRQAARMRHSMGFSDFLSRYRNVINFYDRGDNKVVDAGANWLAQIIANYNLSGGPTNFLFVGIGSGTNAPAPGDIDLQTIISPRLAITSAYAVTNVAHFDTFVTASSNNGTWNETTLCSQLATPDATHPILARRNIGPFTKDNTKTANIAWTITFTPV